MDKFDPDIPGLMEGALTVVVVTDPQPFVGGRGNRVVDPSKDFTITIEWEVFGQLAPLWLAALNGNWDVTVYADPLGPDPDLKLGNVQVPTAAVQPCTVNAAGANCMKYAADIVVPAGTLREHDPNSDQSGIYKLAAAVFLDSGIAGTPGYDLIGFSEGPRIQAEIPE